VIHINDSIKHQVSDEQCSDDKWRDMDDMPITPYDMNTNLQTSTGFTIKIQRRGQVFRQDASVLALPFWFICAATHSLEKLVTFLLSSAEQAVTSTHTFPIRTALTATVRADDLKSDG